MACSCLLLAAHVLQKVWCSLVPQMGSFPCLVFHHCKPGQRNLLSADAPQEFERVQSPPILGPPAADKEGINTDLRLEDVDVLCVLCGSNHDKPDPIF